MDGYRIDICRLSLNVARWVVAFLQESRCPQVAMIGRVGYSVCAAAQRHVVP